MEEIFPKVSTSELDFPEVPKFDVSDENITIKNENSFQPDDHFLKGDYAKLLPNLFIGNMKAAENFKFLANLGVSHILCVRDQPSSTYFESPFRYLFQYEHFPMSDFGSTDFTDLWEKKIIPWLKLVQLNQNPTIFVNCHAGVNRSATVCLALLMQIKKLTLKEAWEHIFSKRLVHPIYPYLSHLVTIEKKIHSTCSIEETDFHDLVKKSVDDRYLSLEKEFEEDDLKEE